MMIKEFSAIKADLQACRENTRYFTKKFLSDYVSAVLQADRDRKAGTPHLYQASYSPWVTLNHAYDNVYSSKFYTKNSCAYCVFLEIFYGKYEYILERQAAL